MHDLATVLNPYRQVDMAILDFSKAFDKVPHQRLLGKLRYYGISGALNGWIEAFLSGRTQRVVVDGEKSTPAPVLSGVLQGSVLGLLLFLLFVNDITDGISSSAHLFADDCLIYREINSQEDSVILQVDLDKLVMWSHT